MCFYQEAFLNKEKDICELVWNTCREDLEDCENVLVGFSGGPDFIFLFYIFARLKLRAALLDIHTNTLRNNPVITCTEQVFFSLKVSRYLLLFALLGNIFP